MGATVESSPSAGPTASVVPARPAALSSVPIVVAAGFYLLLLAVGDKLLNDPDIYWHVALGRWIMAHQQLPHVDVFSYTMAGKSWISSEWLSQVLYALADRAAGWHGVVILASAAIAMALALLTHALLRHLAVVPALILVTAAFVLASPHMTARPHVLALPVMVAWVAGLVAALDEKRAPSFLLLPVMSVWANLHGGFTFGLFLLAPAVLEAVWNAAPAQRRRLALRWAVFAALAVLACCLTPYGPQSFLATDRILGLGPALQLVGEWKPENFATLSPFAFCLFAGIAIALYRGLTLPPWRLLTVLGLLDMALSHSRSADLLGLLAPIYMAAPLAPQIGAAAMPPAARRRPSLQAALALAFVLAAGSAVAAIVDYRPNPDIAPVRALAAVKASGRHRILNSYDFGGYLIAAGVKPFIDGRTELYGKAFLLRYHSALMLRDVGGFLDLLHRYRIDVTMLPPGLPAVGLLDRLPGWKRIYADPVAVVQVRIGPTGRAHGERP